MSLACFMKGRANIHQCNVIVHCPLPRPISPCLIWLVGFYLAGCSWSPYRTVWRFEIDVTVSHYTGLVPFCFDWRVSFSDPHSLMRGGTLAWVVRSIGLLSFTRDLIWPRHSINRSLIRILWALSTRLLPGPTFIRCKLRLHLGM